MESYNNELFAGRYRLEQRLGNGGFGEVWRALDTVTGGEVAVKIHLKENDERAAKEIVKEYTRVRDIHHDNLLTPTYVGIANGDTPYLVMELCKNDLVDTDLEEPDVWHLLRDVASGLARLADNKRTKRRPDGTEVLVADPIIHQDIKPANILLRSNGMYAISDFGISKRRLSSLSTNDITEVMDSAMSVDYAAPERFPRGKGVAVLASDIWSLGAMLYEIVEGHRPFAEGGGDCLNPAIGLLVPVITREGYSDELKQVIYDCMAKAPTDRPTAAQLQEYADCVIKGVPRQRTWVKTDSNDTNPSPINNISTLKWVYWGSALAIFVLMAIILLSCTYREEPVEVSFDSSTPITGAMQVHEEKTSPVIMDGNNIVYTVNGTVYLYNMVRVDGGTFQMGAQNKDSIRENYDSKACNDESPGHRVTVNSFYIGQTEVTQALWNAVMGSEGDWSSKYGKGNNYPAYRVSYEDCKSFISKLNSRTGMSFRLPTEAEWEFAARGGNSSLGYKYSGSDNPDVVAWYDDNSGFMTHPVAQKQANELGLYDMSGNVWEWCNDWYGMYSSTPEMNPLGPALGSERVVRGGSWLFRYHVSIRSSDYPSHRDSELGFRLAI